MKVCANCGVEQPLENFHRDMARRDRHQSYCKQCHTSAVRRAARLKRSGVYAALLDQQRGLCAICKEPMEKPHVDHNHKTGQVRGLLCGPCNRGIGLLRESLFNLLGAADYLEAA